MDREGILVIGSSNMDLVAVTERFPEPGETVLGNRFQMFPGGKGANQAVCCARLGGRTYFIGCVGRDLFGKQLALSMEQHGVDVRYLVLDEDAPSGTALITVNNDGQNQIVVVPGSNMKLTPGDLQSNIHLFREVSTVIVQLEILEETVATAASLAQESGASFILNPAPAKLLPVELLAQVDYLTPNEIELASLAGMPVTDLASAEQAARKLLSKGVAHIVVTLGAQGALLVTDSGVEQFPTHQVEAVDTTAAGDAFNGAFALALSEEQDIRQAIRFANVTASISVTKLGAQSSMPDRETVEAILKTHDD